MLPGFHRIDSSKAIAAGVIGENTVAADIEQHALGAVSRDVAEAVVIILLVFGAEIAEVVEEVASEQADADTRKAGLTDHFDMKQRMPFDGNPRLYTDGVFQTPSGKANLIPVRFVNNNECPDGEYPFWLNSGRVVEHFHTRTRTDRYRAARCDFRAARGMPDQTRSAARSVNSPRPTMING